MRSVALLALSVLGNVSPAFAENREPITAFTSSDVNENDAALAPDPSQVVPPKLLGSPSVDYPPGLQGRSSVVLVLTVDQQGRVAEASTPDESPFGALAVAATRTWRFAPAVRGDRAVASKIRVTVDFVPPSREAGVSQLKRQGSAPPPSAVEVRVEGIRPHHPHQLSRDDVNFLPGAFGDPFRAVEALPGVTPVFSGLPYFYVRGAPPGNVGYVFDSVPVPLLYHVFAGPAVLHPALVDDVQLHSGAYPAKYGRFAGGMVVGALREPEYEARAHLSARLVDAGGLVEVPFAQRQGVVQAAGRYSFTSPVLSLIVPEVTLRYWDYQSRASYTIDRHNRVELFVFGAGDYFAEEREELGRTLVLADFAFHRLDLRWDHDFDAPGGPARLRHALTFGLDDTRTLDEVFIGARHVRIRQELDLPLDLKLLIRAGADVALSWSEFEFNHILPSTGATFSSEPTPSRVPGTTANTRGFSLSGKRRDTIAGGYAELVFQVERWLSVTPGLRVDLFFSGDDFAPAFEPRVTTRFQLTPKLRAVHSLGLAHQLPSYVVPLPGLQPALGSGLQRSVQSSAGVQYALGDEISGSATLFHNALFGLVDPLGVSRLDDELGGVDPLATRSVGHSYGLELLVRRDLGARLGGYASYTLSRSTRAFSNASGPASFDRTHVLNLAVSYHLGANWRLGGRFVYYSGIPANVAYVAAARRPPRTPPFVRLDWRLQKRWHFTDGGYLGLVAEVLNTTLGREVVGMSCSAHECREESIGPVTVPSLGVEGAF